MFSDVDCTKRELVEYYVSVGPGILRALRDRPTTLERWPDGVQPGVELTQRTGPAKEAFFQKRIPKGAPDWVSTARISFPSGRFADEVCPDKLAVIAWAANLATITFHPWPVRKADVDHPDELRIDLDPQPGTDFADAVRIAGLAHELLDKLGFRGFPKTSGGRGLHIYLRVEPRWDFIDMRHAAIAWSELPDIAPLDFTVKTMPARFARLGDLHGTIDDVAYDLSPLIEMYERDERDRGLGEMPYPPDYPKMAGEPLRVQPSRKASD